jgi:hypothetical protein
VARRLRAGLPLIAMLGAAACAGKTASESAVTPVSLPLPAVALAGSRVALYPLRLVVAEGRLGWDDLLRPREAALRTADSVIATFLTERAPEVDWVLPEALRRAAAQAPGMLPDPDHLGTAVLRGDKVERVPDPLRSELRNLTAVAADRHAAVPASLVFLQNPDGSARAELALVLVDVRVGTVWFRTVASGEGDGPWSALWNAMKTLVPDLP